MRSKTRHTPGHASEHAENARALALLEKRDAAFRQTDLYRTLMEEGAPSVTLEEALRIASKIAGSLAADVIAEREKGRG